MVDNAGADEATRRRQDNEPLLCPHCGAQAVGAGGFCTACGERRPAGSRVGPRLLAGRYQMVRTLARGGMSAVHLAEDQRLGGAPVAIKEMQLQQSPAEPQA